MVRWACPKCERRSQYPKATLIERYGADASLVDLRLILADGRPKIAAGKVMDLCGLGEIYNQHHINKTAVRVIEIPGTIAQGEVDSYIDLGALGAIEYRRRNIDLFSKQMMVTISVANTETIYRGHCTPRECKESDGQGLGLGAAGAGGERKSRKGP